MNNSQTISFLLSKIINLIQGINLTTDNTITLIENKEYTEGQKHLENVKTILADLEFNLVIYLSENKKVKSEDKK